MRWTSLDLEKYLRAKHYWFVDAENLKNALIQFLNIEGDVKIKYAAVSDTAHPDKYRLIDYKPFDMFELQPIVEADEYYIDMYRFGYGETPNTIVYGYCGYCSELNTIVLHIPKRQ